MNKVVLSSIIEIISGGTPKTSVKEYWENGQVGWLSVTDFNDDSRFVYTTEKKITELGARESNTKYLEKGDIIISARGTVGALAQIGVPMCFNQSCFGIRGKKGIVDTDFLYYALKNYVKNIGLRSQGSVFNTINLKSFDLMEIQIPSQIEAQKNIAAVLSSFDAKISLNKRINAELEAMAKTIYNYWFVQFDFPISAELAAQMGDTSLQGKPYKSSGGKMVWNEEIRREVPEGWGVSNILTITNLLGGGTPSKKRPEYWNGSIPFFTPSDAEPVAFKLDTEDHITENGLRSSSTRLFPKGTIFITARGSVGNIMIAARDMAMNQSCYAFSPNPKINYPFTYFSTKSLIGHLIAKSSGSVFKSIVSNDIKYTLLPIPPTDVIGKFGEAALPIFERILASIKEIQELASLRDWLLPMLMNGQVKVVEVKEYMQEGEVGMAAEPKIKNN